MPSKDKNQATLSSKQDQERWLELIKSKALITNIQDYINLDIKESNKKELTKPVAPKRG